LALASNASIGKEQSVSGEGEKISVEPSTRAAAPATPVSVTRPFFEQYKTFIIVGILIVAAVIAGIGLNEFMRGPGKDQNRLVLYGNVDLRQVDLAFNNSERIAEVLVQEGAKVARGEVLAKLDTSRLKPQAAAAEAVVQAQQAAVDRLHHGSRPQEIAQAKANVAAARADQVNAQQQWKRAAALTTTTSLVAQWWFRIPFAGSFLVLYAGGCF
jgi:multidrug resistance efflux pump